MKFANTTLLCLAATTAPMLASAGSVEDLVSLIEQVQSQAATVAGEYAGKDAEIADLIERLAQCEGGSSVDTATSSETDMPPVATPSGNEDEDDEDIPVATDSPATDSPATDPPVASTTSSSSEPAPTAPTSTTSETEPETPETPTGGGGGGGGGGDNYGFSVGQSWNYNLASPVDVNADVDVFFIDMDGAQETIDTLHSNGKIVVCYISIGTVEDWRSDAKEFPTSAIGGGVDGWAGEQWLDIKNEKVREIMSARVSTAASMNCDAIEPDNMMVYSEPSTGISATEGDQLEYNTWFADIVHAQGMGVGLKNAVELVPILVNKYDFALNEECHEWNECGEYVDTFIAEGKPVFNVEYNLGMTICDSSNKMKIDTIVKDYDLQAPFCSCVDSSRDIDCNKRM